MKKPLAQLVSFVALAACLAFASAADAGVALKTLCRVKGQEENRLHGLGIVVGLKGTGDSSSSLPMLRALAQTMQHLGGPLGRNGLGELKDTKNVALVMISATVPAQGARQGDNIDCTVSSIGSCKSLAGGMLFATPLVGPEDPRNPRVYAMAEGPIELDNETITTTARIRGGCQLIEDFFNPFVKDGKITLVLDAQYADFEVASEIANLLNRSQVGFQSSSIVVAKAINQNNVEVVLPQQYAEDPVEFVSQVLSLEINNVPIGPRVVINKRSGYIVMSGDAEIAPAIISHKNIVVETGGAAAGTRFVPLDPRNEAATLKSLVEALNAVHVPTEDVIDIIRGLEKDGRLRAKLVVE